MVPLITISIIGGVAGAVVLLHTPQATFMHLVPYLFGIATLLFAFGKRLTRKLGQVIKRTGPPSWPTSSALPWCSSSLPFMGASLAAAWAS